MILKNIVSGKLDGQSVRLYFSANWALLAVMLVAATVFATPQMATGILVGGVIANLNCVGLNRDCKRVVRWRNIAVYYGGLAVRLGLIALVVSAALLVFPEYLSPLGLFIGLSVAVVNFYILVLAMVIYRFRYKEAV
ncbi:MAG TPA: hypothetical protein EYP57_02755 [Thermodesulfobacteriaceae bacterium]|nr:hypothetical protein [Thermodesulfobacteriaceae bacterium]